MGLGKTLSTLGLICLSADSRTSDQDTAHTTLVVTTKSSESHQPPTTTMTNIVFSSTRLAVPNQPVCLLVARHIVLLTSFRHIHDGQLRTALYHGPHRHSLAEHFDEQDLVLTTYETLRADYEAKGPLYENQWHRVVLDEGM